VLFEDSIEFEEVQYYDPQDVANIAAILKYSLSAAILTSCETYIHMYLSTPASKPHRIDVLQ
jgi:hypothetical protein